VYTALSMRLRRRVSPHPLKRSLAEFHYYRMPGRIGTIGNMRAAIFACSLLLQIVTLRAQAAKPWDSPFAADTASVNRAASALDSPAGQPVDMLLEDHHYAIDKSGRLRYEVRKVYKVLSSEEVDEWSAAEEEYQPWREQKPHIRARVITKDGSVHWLDPKTLTDSPAHEFESSVFSDRRVVRVPLPAIAAGAVVEYEVAGEESPALPEAGIARRATVLDNIPLERFRVRIEVAKGGPQLRTVARLIPDSAVRPQPGAETRIEVELGPFPARKEFETNLPPDVPSFPYLAFSTAPSWSAVAARYSEIVEQQIRGADLKPLLEGVDLSGAAPAVASRLANRLHKDVRYTGLELAESAIIPAPPMEVLKRKYGDCKDKSTLLVALLRAAGLKAYVALLNAGPGKDIDEELPGIDLFNHAIVYVENTPPLWMDATASETRIGTHPARRPGPACIDRSTNHDGLDQNRRAARFLAAPDF